MNTNTNFRTLLNLDVPQKIQLDMDNLRAETFFIDVNFMRVLNVLDALTRENSCYEIAPWDLRIFDMIESEEVTAKGINIEMTYDEWLELMFQIIVECPLDIQGFLSAADSHIDDYCEKAKGTLYESALEKIWAYCYVAVRNAKWANLSDVERMFCQCYLHNMSRAVRAYPEQEQLAYAYYLTRNGGMSDDAFSVNMYVERIPVETLMLALQCSVEMGALLEVVPFLETSMRSWYIEGMLSEYLRKKMEEKTYRVIQVFGKRSLIDEMVHPSVQTLFDAIYQEKKKMMIEENEYAVQQTKKC